MGERRRAGGRAGGRGCGGRIHHLRRERLMLFLLRFAQVLHVATDPHVVFTVPAPIFAFLQQKGHASVHLIRYQRIHLFVFKRNDAKDHISQ